MTISMKVFLRVSPFKPPNQCLQRMAVRNNTKRLILSIDNQIGQASHHTPGDLIGIFPPGADASAWPAKMHCVASG